MNVIFVSTMFCVSVAAVMSSSFNLGNQRWRSPTYHSVVGYLNLLMTEVALLCVPVVMS